MAALRILRGSRAPQSPRSARRGHLHTRSATSSGSITSVSEEPDYRAAAQMGPEALPHLRELIQWDDLARATKAASLSGLIQSDDALDVLELAATDPRPTVRVAAAAATRHVSDARTRDALVSLLEDDDPGVRRLAARSMRSG
jgi:HEAT repeat protein